MTVSGRAPGPAAPVVPPAGGMVWVPGATFTMGSDRHYPEETPARSVTVGGFWIDPSPVTNREFGRFMRKTGYVTVAERPPDPADYPGARPEMFVPFSAVFVAPRHRVSLADPHNWWTPVPGQSPSVDTSHGLWKLKAYDLAEHCVSPVIHLSTSTLVHSRGSPDQHI